MDTQDSPPELILKLDAIARGLDKFFTGEPCLHGHVSERYVNGGRCVQCQHERSRKWKEQNGDRKKHLDREYQRKNKEKIRKYQKKYRQKNKEKIKEYLHSWYRKNHKAAKRRVKKWRAENPQKVREHTRKSYLKRRDHNLERGKKWRESNRERVRQLQRKWRQENRHRHNASRARRRASKILATPAWADLEAIARVYAQAKLAEAVTGWPHHVDHIVPLRGKNVCGLHVETNLQILPYDENCSKGNKFDGEVN